MHADVAILGSGFAGSLCALIADKIGLRPVLIDKARHPRFAIGESSTPIANMILRDLAQRYDMPWLLPLSSYGTWQRTTPHLVVGRKRGFSYFYHEHGQSFQADLAHHHELLVAASSDNDQCDTHWLRADFDTFLADKVRTAGIPYFDRTHLHTLTPGPPWTLLGKRENTSVTLTADFIIDGTGAAGAVPHALDIARKTTGFYTQSRALFSHMLDVHLWSDVLIAAGGSPTDHPYACDDAALHHVFDDAWLWLLRFNDDRVSVGLMQDAERFPLNASLSPEAEWQAWLQQYPSVAQQFDAAHLAPTPNRFIRTPPLQRRWTHTVGPTWALLPHTAGFIDPLHSTGIAHSLCGVERLMALIQQHWQHPTLPQALATYERILFQELAFIDRLVAACYRTMGHFDAFIASTMLYFTATITYERQRAAQTGFDRAFLCADEGPLFNLATTCVRWASLVKTPEDVQAYRQLIERAIAPYNTAGLFRPDVPNMYHHTVAPV